MNLLNETLTKITEPNKLNMEDTQKYVDGLLKPVGSLGVLEDIATQIAGISKDIFSAEIKKAVLVFAGDHGICEEGITSAPQPVTALMTNFIAEGKSGVGAISKQAGATVLVTDVGVNAELNNQKVRNKKVRYGTANMTKGSAMTKDEAIKSLEVGIEIANEMIDKGYNLLATGEMGIGNTTPSSAIFSVFGNISPEEVTGIGANLAEDKLRKKSDVIRQAIEINRPDPNDSLDVLMKVGGLEIGAMAGVMLAGASRKVPVLIDGFISSAAAALAVKFNPEVRGYLICSHSSAEKGALKGLEIMGFKPYLHMDMRLGEGSGAALAFNIVEAAISMYNEMGTYAQAGIEVV
ncbi:nicotinate-nucleotide--dimethylbenzimidazole phosphoribosyltransferase [Alkalibacter mobilis]|uniref:nicotinate-nucleotide--dimethylbenzimidazole phosphoribosyltransferase n=1 Tax=Alkalibacter mobilis TaxID=2787712 RepID=UPI0018A0E997|nr:nicotinate-nucleotide--dimethylbenzimidazole phosphoribosyltransferase [Alkalibacter mobilis]MBF7096884.1 nicotinate-nucleotide--dimethylbenzimidazole phosphoribosyltransferase [Alkalibacter mobilis]